MQKPFHGAGALARVRALLTEREILFCAGDSVRYLRITPRVQIMALGLFAMLIGGVMILMGSLALSRSSIASEQAAVMAQRSAIAGAAARARADRQSVDAVAHDLEQRQDALDALMKTHFGPDIDPSRIIGKEDVAPVVDRRKLSSLPGTERLALLRDRQQHFARALTNAARSRLADVEATIRRVGINPRQLAKGGWANGQGGPFIPAPHAVKVGSDRSLRSLASLLDKLAAMESALGVLPSGRPTMAPMMSSSYGYRHDPFNGAAAFHAGLDFPGAYGQSILAASDGRVSFVGQRSGYGNCVEVDHGHGITTRYAHLSGFVAHLGQKVVRGEQIARMGSTGRSTGTHLHFEVRVNGAAIDPRPFLNAGNNGLLAQQEAHLPGLRASGSRG